MSHFLFVSDLHGRKSRYEKLFAEIAARRPGAVLIAGDITPFGNGDDIPDVPFLSEYLYNNLIELRNKMGEDYPKILIIPGNDDPAEDFRNLKKSEAEGLLNNIHMKMTNIRGFDIYGYAMIPPSPFRLKDWERYDVSRYADPESIHPTDGIRTIEADRNEILYSTIADDLERLARDIRPERSIFLFHAPPYDTSLDRAANDDKSIDHVPLDNHIGSIAIRRFIESRKPLITLHGHVHEAARITGQYSERLGDTLMLQGAHDGPELALIAFDPGNPEDNSRELIL
ncbi:MAG: metallophosphoesterase [Candidatus Kapaibacterium sp.]